MKEIDTIEFGVAAPLEYELEMDLLDPTSGNPLSVGNLYPELFVRSINPDGTVGGLLFSVVGVLVSGTTSTFYFSPTQTQAEMLTAGNDYFFGVSMREGTATGKVLLRESYKRTVVETAAKGI